MLVTRKTEVEMVMHNFQIGDQIAVDLKEFGKFTATAQKVMDHGTLFFLDDCVCERQMNERNTNKGGFAESSLRKWMNETLFEAFPDDLKEHMVQFDDGDHLTLPTYGQMFGHDSWYDDAVEQDQDEQLPLMRTRRNRVCDCNDDWCWYWLKNTIKWSSASFCLVHTNGGATYNSASASSGVRPAFLIA